MGSVMDDKLVVGSLVLCLVGISSAGCGLEGPELAIAAESGDLEESGDSADAELPGGTGQTPAGSEGSQGNASDEGDAEGGTDDTGSEGGSSEDTGLPTDCVDDDYEDNDSIAFPAFWDGSYLGAMSCDEDLDAFQIAPGLPAREFVLQQSTGTTAWDEDFAQLVFELTCGQSFCDVDDSLAEWKSVSADACNCPRDERMFISVYPGKIGNPGQGTRYALLIPE